MKIALKTEAKTTLKKDEVSTKQKTKSKPKVKPKPKAVAKRKAKKKKQNSSQRYHRYKQVIDTAVDRSQFELSEIKAAFPDENPGFITRIVHQLENNGWIVSEAVPDSKAKAYRWNSSRKFSVSKWLDEKLFGTQIKQSPEQERPREKLLANGAENLATSELIAILIRSGLPGESAVTCRVEGCKPIRGNDGILSNHGWRGTWSTRGGFIRQENHQ